MLRCSDGLDVCEWCQVDAEDHGCAAVGAIATGLTSRQCYQVWRGPFARRAIWYVSILPGQRERLYPWDGAPGFGVGYKLEWIGERIKDPRVELALGCLVERDASEKPLRILHAPGFGYGPNQTRPPSQHHCEAVAGAFDLGVEAQLARLAAYRGPKTKRDPHRAAAIRAREARKKTGYE